MSDVLVDSSLWIDFFRGDPRAVRTVDSLLADDRVATTGMIAAEVVSGARTRAVFDHLCDCLSALTLLRPADDLWPRLAETRFALARRGVQAHLVDLAIAIQAADARHRLLTRDRDFRTIAKVVPLELEIV
jgi:predicted nucleic acid-binding protein